MSGTDSCPASSSLGRASDSSAMSSLGGVEGGWSHHADRDTRLIGRSTFCRVFACRIFACRVFVYRVFRVFDCRVFVCRVFDCLVDSKHLELICNSKL